jgi:hypothetical protein
LREHSLEHPPLNCGAQHLKIVDDAANKPVKLGFQMSKDSATGFGSPVPQFGSLLAQSMYDGKKAGETGRSASEAEAFEF